MSILPDKPERWAGKDTFKLEEDSLSKGCSGQKTTVTLFACLSTNWSLFLECGVEVIKFYSSKGKIINILDFLGYMVWVVLSPAEFVKEGMWQCSKETHEGK